jgi:hypothetical protein
MLRWPPFFSPTHKGYVALSPSDIQPNDVIATVLGCSTPLVLRLSSRGPQHYITIGEPFAYGLTCFSAH